MIFGVGSPHHTKILSGKCFYWDWFRTSTSRILRGIFRTTSQQHCGIVKSFQSTKNSISFRSFFQKQNTETNLHKVKNSVQPRKILVRNLINIPKESYESFWVLGRTVKEVASSEYWKTASKIRIMLSNKILIISIWY